MKTLVDVPLASIRELLLPLPGDVIVLVLLRVSDGVLLAQAPIVGCARYGE